MATSFPGRLVPGSEVPRVQPALLGNSGLGQTSHDVDQLSQTIRNGVRGPMGSTRYPGRLGPRSVCPRGQSAVPGASGPCPKSRSVDQLSPGDSGVCPRPAGLIRCPGQVGPSLRARGVEQLSRTTGAHVRVLKVSTSCPGLLTIRSEGPRVHKLAWMTHSWV